MFSNDPTAARALLAGRMAQSGERPLAELSLSGGALGGAGALAVGPRRLWLAQPQVIGTPSVASVPVSELRGAFARPRASFLGGFRVEVRVGERTVRFSTQAAAEEVAEFVRQVEHVGRG